MTEAAFAAAETGVGAEVAVGLLASSIPYLLIARTEYEQAIDPPDSNYTELATPPLEIVPEVEKLPEGPVKEFAKLSFEYHASITAAALSRDRALGAAADKDASWQSQQQLAAAKWTAQASNLAPRLASAFDEVAKLLRLGVAPDREQIAASLESDGFPDWAVELLGRFGWTTAQVENLRLSFIANLQEEPADYDFLPTGLRASSLLAVSIAADDLAKGVQVRIEQLGQAVRDLTPGERQGLDAAKAAISTDLAQKRTEAVREKIKSFLSDVAALTLETNNPQAIQTDFEFGLTALLTSLRAVSANDAPTLNPITDRVLDEGGPVSFTVTATDTDEGQMLTYSLDAGAPTGAHIDPNTGVFTWTAAAPGQYPVTVRVTDDGSPAESDSRTFTITVNNVVPTVNAGSDATLVQGATLTRSGSFVDPGLVGTWTATVDYGDGGGRAAAEPQPRQDVCLEPHLRQRRYLPCDHHRDRQGRGHRLERLFGLRRYGSHCLGRCHQ